VRPSNSPTAVEADRATLDVELPQPLLAQADTVILHCHWLSFFRDSCSNLRLPPSLLFPAHNNDTTARD
jgi:hypothetical protein